MRSKWLPLITLLVLLANLACMVWFWQQGLFARTESLRSEQSPNGSRMPFEIICQELQFDSMQRQKMGQLRDVHRAEMRPMMDSMRKLRDLFFSEVTNSSPNPELEANLYAPVSRLQQQIDQVNLYHFKNIRAICTDVQKTRFDAIYRQMLNRFQGPPTRPGAGMREPGGPEGRPRPY